MPGAAPGFTASADSPDCLAANQAEQPRQPHQIDVQAVSDPDLAEVSRAWPALPEALKAAVLALVRASGGDR